MATKVLPQRLARDDEARARLIRGKVYAAQKKFEEARKRAALNPNERPPNPFDNE